MPPTDKGHKFLTVRITEAQRIFLNQEVLTGNLARITQALLNAFIRAYEKNAAATLTYTLLDRLTLEGINAPKGDALDGNYGRFESGSNKTLRRGAAEGFARDSEESADSEGESGRTEGLHHEGE